MIHVVQGDLDFITFSMFANSRFLAVDTETNGLDPKVNSMFLVQLCDEHENIVVLQVLKDVDAPYLRQLLENPFKLKVVHNLKFDAAFLQKTYGIIMRNVMCTLMGAQLAEVSVESYALKSLLKYYFNIKVDKTLQAQDWSQTEGRELTEDETSYVTNDVKYLIPMADKINEAIAAKGLSDLAQDMYAAVIVHTQLRLMGKEKLFDLDGTAKGAGRKKASSKE